MKELSLTDKDLLQKKLESHTRTFRLLLLPCAGAIFLAYFAFRQHWVSQDFPPFISLGSIIMLAAIIFFLTEIYKLRNALARSTKHIVAGKITRKLTECSEYNTEYYLVVNGQKIEVEPEQFQSFKTGDHIKLEFSAPGLELIRIRQVSHKHLLSRACRKARIQAKRLRR